MTLDIVDLVELQMDGGGHMRLTLQGVSPEDMKRLGEFFEILADVVKQGDHTQGRIQVTDPDETCPLIKELQKSKDK